ncbi:hypothetical protein [Cupriavidus sp. UYPR2.512]|uniref:hypothetical protein n=1 Tax=Cupriavidus sp. UYPR2.512 TaxID=1080187 RepID=UPI00350F53FA
MSNSLSLSAKTISTHKTQLMQKPGVQNTMPNGFALRSSVASRRKSRRRFSCDIRDFPAV